MNQENAWPTQVLSLSTKSRSLCIARSPGRYGDGKSLVCYACHVPDGSKKTPSGAAGWCLLEDPLSGLLRGRFPAEVVVIGHAPVDVGIEVPAHCALGVFALRRDNFLPHRVLRRLLGVHLIEHLKLLLQYRVRRLVELHLVLGLQLDVVLRIAVDRLPRHVRGSGF